ncbi:hypothetical protein [Leifsonia sp. SIMBA_070]|uniref:hypothetical protein n=1 Tax=Leifsonia sp. SIMBA_070 TaxID=3085810 RepID=UPI00397D03F2
MGVLEIRDFSYPVDDFTLAHVRAVLENTLPEFPYIDISLFFSGTDRVEFRIRDERDYSIYVREWPALCDQCLGDLVNEVMLSGRLAIVGGFRAGRREHDVQA